MLIEPTQAQPRYIGGDWLFECSEYMRLISISGCNNIAVLWTGYCLHCFCLSNEAWLSTANACHDWLIMCCMPGSQKVWLQLEEKQIPYTIEKINMRCYGDKPREYTAKVSTSTCHNNTSSGRMCGACRLGLPEASHGLFASDVCLTQAYQSCISKHAILVMAGRRSIR